MTQIEKWEYRTFALDVQKLQRSGALEAILNQFGEDGWELTQVLTGEREDVALFKRAVYFQPYVGLYDNQPPPARVLHG